MRQSTPTLGFAASVAAGPANRARVQPHARPAGGRRRWRPAEKAAAVADTKQQVARRSLGRPSRSPGPNGRPSERDTTSMRSPAGRWLSLRNGGIAVSSARADLVYGAVIAPLRHVQTRRYRQLPRARARRRRQRPDERHATAYRGRRHRQRPDPAGRAGQAPAATRRTDAARKESWLGGGEVQRKTAAGLSRRRLSYRQPPTGT